MAKHLKKYGLRRCYSCEKILPLTFKFFFRTSKKGAGGYYYECKKCHIKNKQRGTKRRFRILLKFNFTCQYCGRKAPDVALHVDHIVPRSKGGKNSMDNLTVACFECNIGKADLII